MHMETGDENLELICFCLSLAGVGGLAAGQGIWMRGLPG